jgi:hypothetical protein
MKKENPPIELQSITPSPEERSPIVRMLLTVIESLQTQLQQQTRQLSEQAEQLSKQSEKLEQLLGEIRRLKKLSDKPKIRASTLPKKPDDNPNSTNSGGSAGKRAGSSKRSKNKTLKIDKEEFIRAENVPSDAIHKGYHDYFVQDLIIAPVVTRYRLERWQCADGTYIVAQLPKAIKGYHFGPMLRAYVLHQYHHQCVTQPLLLAQLREWSIDISAGQLNRLLLDEKEDFHAEKSAILKAGLQVSKYIQTDDTGARHKGRNGYCTFIGNHLFSWFESTSNKSRINFLELLRHEHLDYQLTEDSFAYMKRYHVAPWIREKLYNGEKIFPNKEMFEAHVVLEGIINPHYKRLVTEAALIGSILTHGFSMDTVILSDDAGQFNVFYHALCWIHAERGIKSLIADNPLWICEVEWARNEIWTIYQALLDYKQYPHPQLAIEIEAQFDAMCQTKLQYYGLHLVLKRLFKNKKELLVVLRRPEIPLHNNLSESDIREYVKRRKISGSTRSEEGRRCRDTFASLKKTALKKGVGFWKYLIDRIAKKQEVPALDQVILDSVASGA